MAHIDLSGQGSLFLKAMVKINFRISELDMHYLE